MLPILKIFPPIKLYMISRSGRLHIKKAESLCVLNGCMWSLCSQNNTEPRAYSRFSGSLRLYRETAVLWATYWCLSGIIFTMSTVLLWYCWKAKRSLKLLQFILSWTTMSEPNFMTINTMCVERFPWKPHGGAIEKVRGSTFSHWSPRILWQSIV